MTPAPPRPSGPDRGLHRHPGPHRHPGLHLHAGPHPDLGPDTAEPVVAPDPGPAFPGPRPPGTAGEPDGIITWRVRPRRWRRRGLAVPGAVLAAVLAATLLAGVLIWRASPAAPSRAQPLRPHAAPSSLGPAASGLPNPAASRPPGHPQALHPHAVSGLPNPAASHPPNPAQALHPHAVIHMARARQQSRRQRTAQVAADAVTAAGGGGTAAGLHLRGHPGTSSQSQPGPPRLTGPGLVTDGWLQVPGIKYFTGSGSCGVALWTSQVSAGDPAYVAANALQNGSLYPCEAMVETSTDGGRTWTSGTPVTLPASHPTSNPTTPYEFSANTGAVYDGPGYLGRACAEAPNSTLACTAAISLGSGTGTPPDPTLAASTRVGFANAGNDTSVMCDATLNSTTSLKGPGTLVDGEFQAGMAYSTTSSLCEGWLETSADQGATWQASPLVTFQAPAKSVTFDFTGTTADGTGLLVRACAEAPTVSATPWCSVAW
jgi:hypothetical protein